MNARHGSKPDAPAPHGVGSDLRAPRGVRSDAPARPAFHASAWLAWLVAASVVAGGIDNPLASAGAIGALGLVAATFADRGPEGRAFGLMLRIGLAVIAFRVVLFGLTGHTGDTVIATTPALALPAWLGGFGLGGTITAEVVGQSAAEGLRIAAFLACLGVFLSVVRTARLLRMVPRFLHEAALVVSIALAFVPTMLRSAAGVREAQRLRGHRFRGIRSVRPLVVPVLAGALERSIALAESMEARGHGRHPTGAVEREERARAIVLCGLVVALAGGGPALFGRGPRTVMLALTAAGAVAFVAGLRMLSRTVPRTRLAPDPLDSFDRALICASVLIAGLALWARALPAARWYPYPSFTWPAADIRLLALGCALSLPVPVATLRAAIWRRAERAARRPAQPTCRTRIEASHVEVADSLAEAPR